MKYIIIRIETQFLLWAIVSNSKIRNSTDSYLLFMFLPLILLDAIGIFQNIHGFECGASIFRVGLCGFWWRGARRLPGDLCRLLAEADGMDVEIAVLLVICNRALRSGHHSFIDYAHLLHIFWAVFSSLRCILRSLAR